MLERVYGFGSVFAKSLRDARWTAIFTGLALGGLTAVTAWQIGAQFPTVAERQQLALQMTLLPRVFQGLIGAPLHIDTLPGFLSWRVMSLLPVIVGIWPVIALSGTIAGEATRGTLEMVAGTPVSRRRLAAEKVLAHVAALTLALVIAALLTWLSSRAFGVLPGDELSPFTAIAAFGFPWAVGLLVGSIAFALGPLLGRGVAAGAAGIYLFAAYVVNGYGDMAPGFDVLRVGSVFYWTANHRPMAGISDWPAIAIVAGLAAVLLVVGIELFARRDLADSVALPVPRRLGSVGIGVGSWSTRGPGWRSLGERLPAALALGGAIGVYGLFMALSADQLAASLNNIPQITLMIRQFYPDFDLSSGAAMLQLVIFGFSPVVLGLTAAAIVHGWSGEERDGRLETVLAAPLARRRWAIRSGTATLAAVFLAALITGALMALGSVLAGDAALNVLGAGLVLATYVCGLAGVGLAVGGILGPGWAGGIVGALVLAFYLLDTLGTVLGLPTSLVDLSLSRHLGRPISGAYDVPGLAVCAGLALVGLAAGAWGFVRRDINSGT